MRWQIGDVKITKIVEVEGAGGTKFILPQATPERALAIGWLVPRFATESGKLRMSIHSLVVETPARRIVVDTGLGNDKEGRMIPVWNGLNTPYLYKLTEAGYAPETIDTVICTHLHVDHIGWNTRKVGGKWVPTFANARYLFGATEYTYWKDYDEIAERRVAIDDSVTPVVNAGLADIIPDETQVCDEISTVLCPGHSPGHLALRVRSRGEEAWLLGDVAHHPCQMAHPEWSSTYDSDPAQSAATRERVFGALAGRKVMVFGGHYDPGYVARDGAAFRLDEHFGG
jgi:glyoxylase-like metal-dependent hydrolase (beta-lactamase superfamily II)